MIVSRRGRLVAAAVVCVALFCGARSGAGTRAASIRSVWDGVYSKAQADRGQLVYERECTRCHPEGPSTGETFMTLWSGRTADDLYQEIRSTMPQDGPGRLTRTNYLEVVAYTFQANGFPAGTALKAGSDELRAIRIEPRGGSQGAR